MRRRPEEGGRRRETGGRRREEADRLPVGWLPEEGDGRQEAGDGKRDRLPAVGDQKSRGLSITEA